MKNVFILLLVLSLTVMSGCGGREAPPAETPAEGLCAQEGCDRPAAADTDYCDAHAEACVSCGKRIPAGETLCAECLIAQLDALEPTESKSDIAAFK
ncbi:MAG: hypothetical protein IJV41_07770 [Oscillospiraceae bacterium]|nr:hypothetical protein [Oscillospiraceae bacterium]